MASASAQFKKQRRIYAIVALLVIAGLMGSTIIYSLTTLRGAPTPSPAPAQNDNAYRENLIQTWQADIKTLEEKATADPKNAAAWLELANSRYNLGSLYRTSGDKEASRDTFRQAYESYQKSLALKPDDVNARVDGATAAFYADLLDDAEKNFKLAIEKDPRHLNALYNYGIFLIQGRKDPAAAKVYWQKALDTNPPEQEKESLKQMIQMADAMSQPAPNGQSPAPSGSGAAPGAPAAPGGLETPDLSGVGKQQP
ncbi:hypothetical protein GTO89_14340 [Heliobacterium gestii]|uniref:Tetratricopeptide repeat protein n=1 Tax=Heliomicrobium gestii TaxID=2699 RepID=A0A845LC24_HELGE|nr:tetratricopeptide repeat protein [Heliomicrobium gestii]MBM7867820.1 cytochrome c-type biogenesis protein CcmH/NrfG [Heliomicrobium gestii]MZP44212.1 hypothetical protein [Heliomicrobium gestii]